MGLVLLFAVLLQGAAIAQDRHELYDGWSAVEMLDTEVRGPRGETIGEVDDLIVGPDGRLERVVVQAGGDGFFALGSSYIGVPWKQVRVGPEMAYVQVPVTEKNRAGYPLYGGREPAPGRWRVKELIHDVARLEDASLYGRVHDVIFDKGGQARWVIVDRRTGLWGPAGPYAHPYTGYRPGSAYDIPERSAGQDATPRFDYVRLGQLSRFSGSRFGERAGAGATRPGDR